MTQKLEEENECSTQKLFSNRTEIQQQLEQDIKSEFFTQSINTQNEKEIIDELNHENEFVATWKIITMANNIFGEDGWTNKIISNEIDSVDFEEGKFIVTSSSHIRIELKDGTYHEDIGVSTVKDFNKSKAFQNAKKKSISQGIKRTLRLFGNNLGNSIDKRKIINNNEHSNSDKDTLSSKKINVLNKNNINKLENEKKPNKNNEKYSIKINTQKPIQIKKK